MNCRIWLDLETTALDPTSGHILEVAVVATESDAPAYAEVASQTWCVGAAPLPPTTWADLMPEAVLRMHTASGLLRDVETRGTPLAVVEAELVRFLGYFGNPAPGREPIAGFSSHFDVAWLAVHLPHARRYFSHRTFDASTLRQLARDLGRGDIVSGADGAAHRALADCRQAANCARAVARLLGTR